MIGKKIRWYHIVNKSTGKTVIVAIDHGIFAGPMKGLEKPERTLEEIVEGGADAILVTPGIYQKYIDIIAQGGLGVLLRIDESGTIYNPSRAEREQYITCSVSHAVKLGADGVVVMGFIGSRNEPRSLSIVSKVAEEAREYGLVFLAEMYPIEPGATNPHDPNVVKVATRFAAEVGADFIKTFYTGDPQSFREVVESTPIPIVILGGPKRESVEAVLRDVEGAIEAGAIGVAFGRNIWQYKQPAKMVKALAKIVHEGVSVEEALKILG